MAGLPFIKFFPRDWLGDNRLRLCSVAARGLWIDLLCLMHSASRRGYLQTASGSPLPLEQIARMAGCSTDEATRLLQELIDSGTCDRTEHGMIYSRRMVREEGKREKCSAAGRKGGGNPTFKGRTKGDDKGDPKQNSNPSEAQRLRGSEGEKDPPNPPQPGGTTTPRKRTRQEPKPRERNPLFDAIAEVTGCDPKTAGSHIGKVSAALASAEPPYTPDDVRRFGAEFWTHCPWAKDNDRRSPNLAELQKYIGRIRAGPPPAPEVVRKSSAPDLPGGEPMFFPLKEPRL